MPRPASIESYREVAAQRRDDARALQKARRFNGAVYLLGYAVECALKAVFVRQNPWLADKDGTQRTRKRAELFALCVSHDISKLYKHVQSASALTVDRDINLVMQHWSPGMRYSTKRVSKAEYDECNAAVERIVAAIGGSK